MDPTTVSLIVIIVIVVVAVIAWLLYKAGFKTKELTVKAGMVEAKMERETGKDSPQPQTPPARTEVRQTAGDGGVIRKSGISAPAQGNAQINQESTGEGSRIDDSPINLT